MFKKSVKWIMSFLLVASIVTPSTTEAKTSKLKVFINNKEISTDQAPVIKDNRTLIPLRAIFEGLKATVDYNEKKKTITAKKGETTIVLTLESEKATVNGRSVQLDVPPLVRNNRTLIPIRFVSEALGDKVAYNQASSSVNIITQSYSISNLAVKDASDYSDGRDIQVSFTKPKEDADVDHYRAMVIRKSRQSSFNVNNAMYLATNRYVTISKGNTSLQKSLFSSTLDVQGQPFQNDIDYVMIVASMNKNKKVLTYETVDFSISNKHKVNAVNGLKATDASDYGDARDIEIAFTKPADETNIVEYRAFVVRTEDEKSFNLSAALELPSSSYTTISKTGENIKLVLSSSTKDHKGRKIEEDIPYKIYVLSVGNQSRNFSSSLSTGAGVTLKGNPQEIRVSKLAIKDTQDYGDGRDIEVSFTAPTNPTRVSEYRVFVVRDADAKDFTLDKAQNLSSAFYTSLISSSSEVKTNLHASLLDTSGKIIQNDVSYKVFVLSMGQNANSYKNSLSTASPSIKLANTMVTSEVTNLTWSDVSDWGDGRDLEISFNKVADETKLAHYRILVVKASQSYGFNIANAVSTAHYTTVAKTGENLKVKLTSTSRDVYGELIREGVQYKVYVLSVSAGGNSANHKMTAGSDVALTKNTASSAVTNLIATDVGNVGNANDIEVTFDKVANEGDISEYRIYVLKKGTSFDVNKANAVVAGRYVPVPKTGNNPAVRLPATTKDVYDQKALERNVEYDLYVLTVSSTGNANVLSGPKPLKFADPTVGPATNVTAMDIGNNGNGSDISVSFNGALSESEISYYDILVVPAYYTSNLTLVQANEVLPAYRTRVPVGTSPYTMVLDPETRDITGNKITRGARYHVYIMSIAISDTGHDYGLNALSTRSNEITIN